jgi:hypothetical protein
MVFAIHAVQILSVALALSSPDGTGFSLSIPDVEASPGATVQLMIYADGPTAYQGFSLSVRYPSVDFEVTSLDVKDTIIEAIDADFVSTHIFPNDGIFVLGVLVDASPPFDGALVPVVGSPLAVGRVTGRVLLMEEGNIPFQFAVGLLPPFSDTVFAVDNLTVAPSVLQDGNVIVSGHAGVPGFIRGDTNLDGMIDVSDPITILNARFFDGEMLKCEAAADANCDTSIDLSDTVFLFYYLFLYGQRPLPPQGTPGPDFMKKLTCEEPLVWLPR